MRLLIKGEKTHQGLSGSLELQRRWLNADWPKHKLALITRVRVLTKFATDREMIILWYIIQIRHAGNIHVVCPDAQRK